MLHRRSLLRVLRIVAGVAKADEIIIHIRQLRILIHVLDVMHFCRFGQPAVSPAVPAHVAIPAQNCGTLMLPTGAIVRKCFSGRHHGLSPPGRPGQTKKPEPATNTRLCCLLAPAFKALASVDVYQNFGFAILAIYGETACRHVRRYPLQPVISPANRADQPTALYRQYFTMIQL